MNVMFDEIDQENMPRVLADLHVSQCNGPKDSLVMHLLSYVYVFFAVCK